jgi:hypothetical protein
MSEKMFTRSINCAVVGGIYFGVFRDEDIWGNWHEDDYFCQIKTKRGTVDIAYLIGEALGLGYTYCASWTEKEKCEEERDECPYKDEEGVCRPPLFKVKMNIEIEPYDERAKEFLRKIILLKQKEAEKVQTAQIKARCANCIHLEKVDFTRYRCPKNEILPPPETLSPWFAERCNLYRPKNSAKTDV